MRIAVNTSLDGLDEVKEALLGAGSLQIPQFLSRAGCLDVCKGADAIFTNPNNLGFRYDYEFLSQCDKLKYFVTASTGTDHIDLTCLKDAGVKLFCLRDDTAFMSKVTATAEHAMCLTLAMARKLPIAFANVYESNWSWEGCVGTQISSKAVGVVGYGRLGKLYASYMAAMSASVTVYDPFISELDFGPFKRSSIEEVMKCDIVSIHMHADPKNLNWLDKKKLAIANPKILIINTSRGGIVNEIDLASFLLKNKSARYATDVLANELDDFRSSPLFHRELSEQVMITPHIGGMTSESRSLAFGRVVELFLGDLKNG